MTTSSRRLLAGRTVAAVLGGDPGLGPRLGGAAIVGRGGGLPGPATTGPVEAIISDAAIPRVTIDGRWRLGPEAIRATAEAVLLAGARLAGPLPSEAAATDLFVHELNRQSPDVLVLCQPLAGERLKALAHLVARPPDGRRPLTVIYNGPPGYQHRLLEESPGCAYLEVAAIDATARAGATGRSSATARISVTGRAGAAGRTNPGPTMAALEAAVAEHLGEAVARAGHSGAKVSSVGHAAAAAATRLAAELPSLVDLEAGNPTEVCLLVVEPDGVSAFTAAPGAGQARAASVSLTGTGTVDLPRPGRANPGNLGGDGHLPAWSALASRLPVDLDENEIANLVGATLVRPWVVPEDPVAASLGGALVEELLSRLAARWPETVGPAGNPSRCRVFFGVGFGLARLGGARRGAAAILNAFEPRGVTVIGVDPWGAFLFDGLAELRASIAAVSVAPFEAAHDWTRSTSDPWAIVTIERADGSSEARRLVPGRVGTIALPPGTQAHLSIEPCQSRLDFGAGPGNTWHGTIPGGTLGVVLDGRGRPVRPAADPVLRAAKQNEFLAAFGEGRSQW